MRRWVLLLWVSIGIASGAGPAWADPHDSQRSGHPLRITAYVLHPVGVLADTLLFRPAHWLVHRHPSVESLFGHTN
jgi:hypothetical protein